MIENAMPSIAFTEYTRQVSHEQTPVKVLNAFGEEWGMKPEYQVNPIRKRGGPTTYVVTFTVGFRKGEGSGATVAEAKAEAATNCLDDLFRFVPEDRRLAYKPVIKTDPCKDILYIIQEACTEYGFKMPCYKMEPKENGGFKYTASIGEVYESGEADKKRVAIRIAAVNLYKKLRKLYNAEKLPASVKK